MPKSAALAALTTVGTRREDLDRSEFFLIATARAEGGSWTEVAGALGLRSRQAAEQRWLRLSGAVGTGGAVRPEPQGSAAGRPAARNPYTTRTLRRDVPVGRDDRDVARLRARATLLYDQLVQLPVDSPAAPRIRLARATLATGVGAPAGALHDLTRQVVLDLHDVPPALLGPAAVRLLGGVREALTPDLRAS